jgi:glycine/D-amino acid oxidase-like deaminating enzyme
MRVAIIGAGFCGLAVAWHLLNHIPPFPLSSLVLFDSIGIGGGASGIAAGLLHPFAGAHAKLNRMGREGLTATRQLLEVSAQALGQPVSKETGILRLALTEDQKQDFLFCQHKYPMDVKWLEKGECQQLFPYLTPAPGLWIKEGLIVQSALYLKGLWQACEKQGAILERRQISTPQDLKDFDLKIITAGAASLLFAECSHLPLSVVKGQILELEWPKDLPPLPFPLNSHAYLLMNETDRTCLVGATFEKGYKHIEPNPEIAKAETLPKAIAMLPAIESVQLVNCHAGLRAVTPTHLPLMQQVSEQVWVLTGMGSKGLLYHALMAKKLVDQLQNRET